jgi:hypothetical protein
VILGAGVYALVGPAPAQAGRAMWPAFVLAGISAGLTGYSFLAATGVLVAAEIRRPAA